MPENELPHPPEVDPAGAAPGLPEVNPDIIEQEDAEDIDNTTPSRGYGMLPVVGLGGSAGALPALRKFFEAMPPDTGMAFVVILHLSSEHESILAELLQRSTRMAVRQVQGKVTVEPNCVYVIPPGKLLSMVDGSIELTTIHHRTGKHVTVDLFFRTLADTHGPRSAAIVLSGADGDGAIGIKRVKERGGLTVVQDPEEAEYDSMPRTSIATGLVDWVLPIGQIPARLVEYWRTEHRLRLPPEQGPDGASRDKIPDEPADPRLAAESTLHDLLGVLRVRTGHDFTYYKRATVLRRIGRRMQVHDLADAQAYLAFIRSHPTEADALLRDLLISVTNFFRDRDAFAALEQALPAIFRGKGSGSTVRVWVTACATGEEAYSVAIHLLEFAATLEDPPSLQVFATDLDEHAIEAARDGKYSEAITADVSEERLRRFFAKEHGGYRVRREVRETVLFAVHDLLKDSPFSRLDLVTCRNLLIYLNEDAQTRALEIFHFALGAEGMLFLGSSESVDEDSALFSVLDKKRRIYVRRPGRRTGLPFLSERDPLLRGTPRQLIRRARTPSAAGAGSPPGQTTAARSEPVSWSELHFRLIEKLAPPSLVVRDDHQVLHVSERAGRYLRVGGGEPTTNVLHLVHPGLRPELRAALNRAAQASASVFSEAVALELEGGVREVTMRVDPVTEAESKFLLVIFQENVVASGPASAAPLTEPSSTVGHLQHELDRTRAQLYEILEQSASDEELKAFNEELQAINEELRSAGEELETGAKNSSPSTRS